MNLKGRPKLGQSMAEIAREYLSGQTEYTIESTGNVLQMERKMAFVRKVYALAMSNDPRSLAAMRLIWSYIDGLPTQAIQVTHPIDITVTLAPDVEEIDFRSAENVEIDDGEGQRGT